jgi:glycyl-tRNA synthetase (class II)
MVGLDSSIILPKRVWEASGHVATFTDPLVECLHCHKRFRADNLIEDFEARKGRRRRTASPTSLPQLRHQGPVHRAEGVLRAGEDLPRRRG